MHILHIFYLYREALDCRIRLQEAAEAEAKRKETLDVSETALETTGAELLAARADALPRSKFRHPGSFTGCGGNPDGFAFWYVIIISTFV